MAGGGCLHCGHWVRMTFIPGEPQSHTVWSAASPARAPPPAPGWAVGWRGAKGHEPLQAPAPGGASLPCSLSPRVLFVLALSVSCPTPALAGCPLSLCFWPWAGQGRGPSAPGRCPVCSWPVQLESRLTSWQRAFSAGPQLTIVPPSVTRLALSHFQAPRGHQTPPCQFHKHR